ncbi:hypothetical protein [uncultured Shewanella sp.]|uniref:hypothetical protein n=1 Tax=uncultured Shewanella sp. TaxID=173975 RepID=UPI00261A5DCD|nr:hypothetical protein [uncultured Shewanella sp.]
MIMQEFQRFALECTFSIGQIPESAPQFTLERFLIKLQNLVLDNKAVHKTKDDTVTLRLSKLDINEETVVMLFKYADINATDPSFTHSDTGDTRTEPKKDGEGISVSSHLVLLRNPKEQSNQANHDAIFEEVPGISRKIIEAGLTHMLKECAVEHFEKKGSKKENMCRPKISLTYDGNDSLEQLLKKGHITGFVAVKTKLKDQLDEESKLIITDEKITFKVKRSMGEKAMRAIQTVKSYASKNDYSKVQIRYQSNDKRSKTFEVKSREENIAEKMFAKSTVINLTEKVEQCQEDIHNELKKKLIYILNDNLKA